MHRPGYTEEKLSHFRFSVHTYTTYTLYLVLNFLKIIYCLGALLNSGIFHIFYFSFLPQTGCKNNINPFSPHPLLPLFCPRSTGLPHITLHAPRCTHSPFLNSRTRSIRKREKSPSSCSCSTAVRWQTPTPLHFPHLFQSRNSSVKAALITKKQKLRP